MFDETESKIIQALDSVVMEVKAAGGSSNGEWTKKIKQALCQLGES